MVAHSLNVHQGEAQGPVELQDRQLLRKNTIAPPRSRFLAESRSERREECSDVVALKLPPVDNGPLPTFRPGQYISPPDGRCDPLLALPFARATCARWPDAAPASFRSLWPHADMVAAGTACQHSRGGRRRRSHTSEWLPRRTMRELRRGSKDWRGSSSHRFSGAGRGYCLTCQAVPLSDVVIDA